jgi:hypothetical protein
MSTSLTNAPSDVSDLWGELDYEVTWLHGRWQIYRQLFGTSEERVEILNRSAGTFTFMLQTLLLEDVQLGLAKLGDPTMTGRFRNLTVTALVEALASHAPILAPALQTALTSYQDACRKLRTRRNKWIAHLDHNTLVNRRATPLIGPSREEIEIALSELRSLMNTVQLHYSNSQTAYELIVLDSDGEHLIAMLKRGIRYQQLVRSGVVAATDLTENWNLA